MNIGDVFGFHTVAQADAKLFTKANNATEKKEVVRFINVAKIVSYIPIIGTIAAIVKLALINQLEKDVHRPLGFGEMAPYMRLRCWLEIVPVASSLLVIPDLIATIGRNLC